MANPLRVLIVDDNKDDATLLVLELHRGGFEPIWERVDNPAAMRAALADRLWDLVLADFAMPLFSGPAALEMLHESGLDLPFIVVSGTIGEERAAEMMRAGAHDVILKEHLVRLVPAITRELRDAEERRERQRTEEALRESEARYRGLVETALEGIWVLDTRFKMTYVNPRLVEMLGYAGEEMLGRSPGEFVEESSQAKMMRHLALLNQGTRELDEYCFRRKDGSALWAIVSGASVSDAGGRISGSFAMLTDITERKQAEEALREQQEFLRIVIDTVPNFIGVKDWDGRFILANRALAEVYGTTAAEIIGKTDADFNPNVEEVEWFRRDDQEVIRTRKAKYIPEEKVTDSTGRVRWLSTVKVPLVEKDGTSARVLLATHDITERKQAEDALARERAFLASAIELLPFPIIFNSLSGDVIRANQASYQFFGDLSPASWWERQLLDPKTGVPIDIDQWPMMRAARGEVVPPTEGTLVLPNGRGVPVLAVAAPVYVGETMVATVVSFTDITPLKEADREKNQFLSVLSHELRTPLTNILGWVKEAQEIPEIIPQALQIIRRSAESQYRILENLLEISRLIHRKLTLKTALIDLWQVTSQTVEPMRDLAAERRITVLLEPPEQPLPVKADVKRMREVISNLVDNAIKYTDPGGRVTVNGRREGDWAVISMRDTGRGILPKQLPNLFKLFQAPEKVEATEGLHLGLPLVKNIVELHGGQVSVESRGAGQGSLVTVKLPLAG